VPGLQLIGELAATLSGMPVPRPVIGMVLLLALLLKIGHLPDELATLSTGFLRPLYLYYLPATRGRHRTSGAGDPRAGPHPAGGGGIVGPCHGGVRTAAPGAGATE
jgi:hypothetical protein